MLSPHVRFLFMPSPSSHHFNLYPTKRSFLSSIYIHTFTLTTYWSYKLDTKRMDLDSFTTLELFSNLSSYKINTRLFLKKFEWLRFVAFFTFKNKTQQYLYLFFFTFFLNEEWSFPRVRRFYTKSKNWTKSNILN